MMLSLFALALLTGLVTCEPAETQPIECVRRYYLLSAENEAAIAEGMAFLETQRARLPAALADAYQAALTIFKARYAFWPHTKMRYVRQGLLVLDSLVAAHPEHMEIRCLRLLSIYYLPFFFGRKEMAQEDMRRLTQQLLKGDASLPDVYRRMMVEFLLANAPLSESERVQLQTLYHELETQEARRP